MVVYVLVTTTPASVSILYMVEVVVVTVMTVERAVASVVMAVKRGIEMKELQKGVASMENSCKASR